MEPTVLIIATLDTKETETTYLQEQIEAQGLRTLLMDTGILAAPQKAQPAVTGRSGTAGGMEPIVAGNGDKGKCIATMLNGAGTSPCSCLPREICRRDWPRRRPGTNIATAVMQALPFGIPN